MKPVPVPGVDDGPYWNAHAEGRVVLPRCTACDRYQQRWPLLCPECGNEDYEWSAVSGLGVIYTYTVAHRTWVAGFDEDLPYVVVSVALDEQPDLYLTTNLIGSYQVGELDIGLRVRAAFESRGDRTILQFALDRR